MNYKNIAAVCRVVFAEYRLWVPRAGAPVTYPLQLLNSPYFRTEPSA